MESQRIDIHFFSLGLLVARVDGLIERMDATLQVAKKQAPSIGIALVRTWCIAWLTDTRFGTTAAIDANCRLGCVMESGTDLAAAICWRPETIGSLALRRVGRACREEVYLPHLQAFSVAVRMYNVTAAAQRAGEKIPVDLITLIERPEEAFRQIERVTAFSFSKEKLKAFSKIVQTVTEKSMRGNTENSQNDSR